MGRFKTRQETLSTSKQDLIIPDKTRISWTILNEDTAINVLIHESDAAAGFVILPQTSFGYEVADGHDPTNNVKISAASGTPTIRIFESFA